MTLPSLAFLLGMTSLVAGLVAVQPAAIVIGLVVVTVALYEGRA